MLIENCDKKVYLFPVIDPFKIDTYDPKYTEIFIFQQLGEVHINNFDLLICPILTWQTYENVRSSHICMVVVDVKAKTIKFLEPNRSHRVNPKYKYILLEIIPRLDTNCLSE